MPPVVSDEAGGLAERFARRFPVKNDGTSAAFTWERGGRAPAYRFEPARSTRGGRRNDGVSWCMWAYHAALGDTTTLTTTVRGQRKAYVLRATPAEGRAYLEWQAARPGFNLLRGTARQWLSALNRVQASAAPPPARPRPAKAAPPGWPKLRYRQIGDRLWELAVQDGPRAPRVPIGTVRKQGSLPSMTRWYGRGNWDGAQETTWRDTRGDAGAKVWAQWRDREAARNPA